MKRLFNVLINQVEMFRMGRITFSSVDGRFLWLLIIERTFFVDKIGHRLTEVQRMSVLSLCWLR